MKGQIIFLIVLVSLFINRGNAQAQEIEGQDQVLLHGIVMDSDSQSPLSNVHYLISSSLGGTTNEEGKFSMFIYRSDTVVFSYLGYADYQFSLSDTLIGKSFVAGIFLETDTLALGEVVVLPRMSDLRSEFRNTEVEVSKELINAENNLKVATYQGLHSEAALGDPNTNYELLKRKQIITANERGGIPSDKMLGLNFISVIPAAIYLLRNGLPERPEPPAPHVSDRELDRMIDLYRKHLKEKRKE